MHGRVATDRPDHFFHEYAGIMNQPTRMFNTLCCLAVTMTSASLLLGWVDPSVEIPEVVLSVDELLSQADTIVNHDVQIQLQRWADIEILSGPAVMGSGKLLAASSDDDPPHFMVDLSGHVFRGGRWRSQTPSIHLPHSICIRVASSGKNNPMSVAQWAGVRALVSTLNHTLGPVDSTSADSSLPVFLQEVWSDVYHLEKEVQIQIAPL